ncbi:MAG: ABC transporter substrate-binding protein, partial [candidate division WOR-3 bacterium]
VEPFSTEIDNTIKDAEVSLNSLINLLTSLKAVSDLLESLQNFIHAIETGSEIFSEIETKINVQVDGINKQLTASLNTVDEISLRGSEIYNLSQILYELYSVVSSPRYGRENPYLLEQFKYLIDENIRILKKINIGVRPTLLSSELVNDLNYITKQINTLYEIIVKGKGEVENLGIIMDKVSVIRLDVNQIFSTQGIIVEKIKDFKNILGDQLLIIESLTQVGSKIIDKLKTLSIFSRLEQSHSVEYKDLITPIIDEFRNLSNGINLSFSALEDGVSNLRKILNKLGVLVIKKEVVQLNLPDFSRIKIFYDDVVRVFENCFSNIKSLRNFIGRLDKANFLLHQHWIVYEEALREILNFSVLLQKFVPQKFPAPSISKTRSILKINLFNDPVTLKPDLKTDATSQQVIVNYSAGLFQFGFGTAVILGLCDDYSISEDGRIYTFHIRDNLKYSNGRKLQIGDIKAGILKGLSGPNHNLLEMIFGAKDFLNSRDPYSLWVKEIDQHRIQVKLDYPYLPFLANFATNVADPYIDEDPPVGMGPFKILNWERGKEIILEANNFYFEGRPQIDILKFIITVDEDYGYELFKSGELSIYQPGQKSLRKIKQEFPELLIMTPELSVQFLCFHCQKSPFNNKLVRKAIYYGINVEKLVSDLLSDIAIPAKGIFPPSLPMYNRKLVGYKYDPHRSVELLSQAGFQGGLPDIYPLTVSDTPMSIKRAEFIKSNLNEIGIKIEINPLPWHEFLEKCYQGNFLLCLQGWISDTGDPDNFLYPLFHTNSFGYAGNTFFFSNNEIDKMIENARQIRNIRQRYNYYQLIEEKILDEAPGVFLFHSLKNVVVKKDVRGFKSHPLSILRLKYTQKIMEVANNEILSEMIASQCITV